MAALATDTITVENPATGEVIRTVELVAPGDVAEVVERGRAAQPAWAALGFDGRAAVLRRAQKWVTDNAERLIATIVSETGKTYEDAQNAEVAYVAAAFGFWAKRAPRYLADEKVRSVSPDGGRPPPGRALRAARGDRRHRAVELPADQLGR